MANIYTNPALENPPKKAGGDHDGYQEPDTKIPPKAKPVLNKVAVNGIEIPENVILSEAQHHPAGTPGEAIFQAAQALVVRELLLQEARNMGIVPRPSVLESGKPETSEEALIRQLMEQEIVVPDATADECERYYENNLSRFSSEAIYEASHILIAAPTSDTKETEIAREKAEKICKILKSDPARFGDLVKEFSDCPSKDQGGNLGQLTKGSTVEEFEQALKTATEVGLISEPVASRFGYHVIRLDRKIPGRVLPFEHVRSSISNWMEAASWTKAVSQYVRILAGKAKIEGISVDGAESPLVG